MKADTKNYLGFLYCITHSETGRMYVGKKQYFYIKQPRKKGCKSLISDKSSPRFKGSCWTENGWRDYTGSSKDFNKFLKTEGNDKFTFEIIRQCRSKSELHYGEVEEMVVRGVLWKKDADGEYIYFNRQIGATRFRIPNYDGDFHGLAE